MPTKKTNGKARSPEPERVTVALSKQEQEIVRKHDEAVAQLSAQYTQLSLQAAEIEAQRAKLLAAIQEESARALADVQAMARSKGIDTNKDVQFNPREMTISGERTQ